MTANQRAGSLWASLVGIISLQPIDEKRGSLTVAAIEMIERALIEERKAGVESERKACADIARKTKEAQREYNSPEGEFVADLIERNILTRSS